MAERYMICKGDKTTHGGTVLEGSAMFMVEGVPVAHVGHQVSCPQCNDVFSIVEGTSQIDVMGMKVALEGMKTACGALLISSQTQARVDDPNWASRISQTRHFMAPPPPERLTVQDVPLNHFAANNSLVSIADENEDSTKGVEAYLITTYGIYGLSPIMARFSDHSALYISIDDAPFIYDPAGSYLDRMRGSGDFFIDEEANLSHYSQYHADRGDKVVLVTLTLTRKQAKNIIQKAIDSGGGEPMYCAEAISNILSQDYGTEMRNSIIPLVPDSLRTTIEKIEEQKRKNR